MGTCARAVVSFMRDVYDTTLLHVRTFACGAYWLPLIVQCALYYGAASLVAHASTQQQQQPQQLPVFAPWLGTSVSAYDVYASLQCPDRTIVPISYHVDNNVNTSSTMACPRVVVTTNDHDNGTYNLHVYLPASTASHRDAVQRGVFVAAAAAASMRGTRTVPLNATLWMFNDEAYDVFAAAAVATYVVTGVADYCTWAFCFRCARARNDIMFATTRLRRAWLSALSCLVQTAVCACTALLTVYASPVHALNDHKTYVTALLAPLVACVWNGGNGIRNSSIWRLQSEAYGRARRATRNAACACVWVTYESVFVCIRVFAHLPTWRSLCSCLGVYAFIVATYLAWAIFEERTRCRRCAKRGLIEVGGEQFVKGVVHVFTGSNGSGKTKTLRDIAARHSGTYTCVWVDCARDNTVSDARLRAAFATCTRVQTTYQADGGTDMSLVWCAVECIRSFHKSEQNTFLLFVDNASRATVSYLAKVAKDVPCTVFAATCDFPENVDGSRFVVHRTSVSPANDGHDTGFIAECREAPPRFIARGTKESIANAFVGRTGAFVISSTAHSERARVIADHVVVSSSSSSFTSIRVSDCVRTEIRPMRYSPCRLYFSCAASVVNAEKYLVIALLVAVVVARTVGTVLCPYMVTMASDWEYALVRRSDAVVNHDVGSLSRNALPFVFDAAGATAAIVRRRLGNVTLHLGASAASIELRSQLDALRTKTVHRIAEAVAGTLVGLAITTVTFVFWSATERAIKVLMSGARARCATAFQLSVARLALLCVVTSALTLSYWTKFTSVDAIHALEKASACVGAAMLAGIVGAQNAYTLQPPVLSILVICACVADVTVSLTVNVDVRCRVNLGMNVLSLFVQSIVPGVLFRDCDNTMLWSSVPFVWPWCVLFLGGLSGVLCGTRTISCTELFAFARDDPIASRVSLTTVLYAWLANAVPPTSRVYVLRQATKRFPLLERVFLSLSVQQDLSLRSCSDGALASTVACVTGATLEHATLTRTLDAYSRNIARNNGRVHTASAPTTSSATAVPLSGFVVSVLAFHRNAIKNTKTLRTLGARLQASMCNTHVYVEPSVYDVYGNNAPTRPRLCIATETQDVARTCSNILAWVATERFANAAVLHNIAFRGTLIDSVNVLTRKLPPSPQRTSNDYVSMQRNVTDAQSHMYVRCVALSVDAENTNAYDNV